MEKVHAQPKSMTNAQGVPSDADTMASAEDEVVIRPKTGNHPRAQSAYMTLLSSLATDLDLMLNDLRSAPPRFIRPRASFPIVSTAHFGSETTHLLGGRRLPLGSVDSEDCNLLADDELQTLLPGTREISTDDLSQSRASLVSSSDGGILAEGETSTSETSGDSTSPPCDLGLFERLLLTHPVWFLPGIQRAGAVHLLQGKEEGNFIVRGSSQTNTMAVSVRLPPDTGPYIEHYLIQSRNGILSLESSRFEFDSIPALIDHYAKCCDELPVQLALPRAFREAQNRQQLSSLALLGQEFWRYPMANPRAAATTPASIATAISPMQTSSKTESSGIGTTVFSAHQHKIVKSSHTMSSGAVFSPTTPSMVGIPSLLGTPSDTASSLSSFTSTSQQILSPESIDSMLMSPDDAFRTGIVGKTSTFKTQNRKSMDIEKLGPNVHTTTSTTNNNNNSGSTGNLDNGNIRSVRPTPPSTLNLGPLRIPPAPPPRWKSATPNTSPNDLTPVDGQTNNFTVTTTVTFSVDGNNVNPQLMDSVMSPNANQAFQTISKRLSPEGECKTSADTMSSHGSKRWQNQDSCQRKIISPASSDAPSGRTKRSRARKESKHYQESDILESPQVYCRSNLGDKISDYEDLWTQENGNNQPTNKESIMSSFRSATTPMQKPDTSSDCPMITSLNENLLSPAGSAIADSLEVTKTPDESQQTRSDNDAAMKCEAMLNQPRNRLGLLLPSTVEVPSPTSDSTATPTTQTPVHSRSKQSSPFYAEPADAVANVIRRSQRGTLLPHNQRHSEPSKVPLRVPSTQFHQVLSPIESEKSHISNSLDELKKAPHRSHARGRVEPWPLDSSWEFVGNDDQQNGQSTDNAWKYGESTLVRKSSPVMRHAYDARVENHLSSTVNQIIAKRLPDLKIAELMQKTTQPLAYATPEKLRCDTFNANHRSNYDNNNSGGHSGYASSMICHGSSAQSDDGTVFSEPWDSSQWDSFLPNDDTMSESIHLSKCRPVLCNSEDDTIMEEPSFATANNNNSHHQQQQSQQKRSADHLPTQQKVATILRTRSCRDREVLSHPRNKAADGAGPGDSIGAYALTLANDPASTFSRNIENFISCTKESREAAPQIVMRNMRQFMSGMKNYLVKHGEGDFQREVLRARSMLKSDEFLNLDTILESVMHQLVVLPLREHLYGLFVDYYSGTGDIQLLVENVKHAFGKTPLDFGIRPCIQPPSPQSMRHISLLILRMQEAELPLAKLEILLSIVSMIIETTTNTRGQALGADDFLPLLVYIVAKCGFIAAEIEAEFMWCLLQPSLLNGEAGYYLTALCSAVHVLKSFITSEQDGTGTLDFRSSSLPACSSVLRVIIPDEYNGSLQTRTLPIRPHTTTKEVCRTIAHKARVTNPQDYGLFKLVDGEETLLMDSDCPQEARLAARGKPCMLAYKRIDAKIAWPTTTTAFQ